MGVSYEAKVYVNGDLMVCHRGIWDAFDVSIARDLESAEIEVRVTKNGGARFPVQEVLSGFLPFVFNTFGGIFREVYLGEKEDFSGLDLPPSASRIRLEKSRIFLDHRPTYLRGVLHWGWYPELGHPNPPSETILKELDQIKAQGFNLVKFCLWLPSHRYLELLAEKQLWAWIELPLWDPSPDHLEYLAREARLIARQYRHHANVIAWTGGCELGSRVPAEFRNNLFESIAEITQCPLVKDNSGGSEMYGSDLREFGTFEDFHPYCDLTFYPSVLDSLVSSPPTHAPILLGEFNDIDVHRNLPAIAEAYWASADPTLNAQGVRWQYDLPRVLSRSNWSKHSARQIALLESSRQKALFIRKTVHEAVRARARISGYVVTGLRDTPISSSGLIDDFGEPRFSREECAAWNGPDCLFLLPTRRPPWIHGGNRPGWRDPLNHFAGTVHFRLGLACEQEYQGEVAWELTGGGHCWYGVFPARVNALDAVRLGAIDLECVPAGEYLLRVEITRTTNTWPIWVVPPIEPNEKPGLFDSIVCMEGDPSNPVPFWRESAYEFVGLEAFANHWSRWLPICGDHSIPLDRLPDDAEVLVRRIDTRTYEETAVVARCNKEIWTTARPMGGLGNQPVGLEANPAGVEFLRTIQRHIKST